MADDNILDDLLKHLLVLFDIVYRGCYIDTRNKSSSYLIMKGSFLNAR
jgi:hypothetical protein